MIESVRGLKPTRPTIDDIVVNELQSELNEINDYRYAVASGIDDKYHPVLDDHELTDALEKVISYYQTKIEKPTLSYDSDDAFADNIQDGFDSKWTPGGYQDWEYISMNCQ